MSAIVETSWLYIAPIHWVLLLVLAVVVPAASYQTRLKFQPMAPAAASSWRQQQYVQTIALLWAMCATAVVTWWLQSGRWDQAGLLMTESVLRTSLGFLIALIACVTLLRPGQKLTESQAKSVLKAVAHDKLLAHFVPHDSSDRRLWIPLSLTAGFTEEVIYRGILLGILSPVMGFWGAAAVSVVIFSLSHLYQGPQSMLRVAMVGAGLTLLVWLSGCIWPAVLVHAAIDLSSGNAMLLARETLARQS